MSAVIHSLHPDRILAQADPMRRSADVETRKPVHPFVTLLFGIGYLSALLFACWLAGVDVGVMHLVHWLRSVMP